ncbi:MAG: rod shape-determining protein MreD [Candidatus Eremiobacteraeota bacterium]|nr:rod shape-determining protein MreD [Candidatus Eremiobacteraeota bacterium]
MSRSKIHEPPFAGPSWAAASIWLVAALLAQVTIVHAMAFRGVEPSLVLVAVVWFAIRVNAQRAAIYGLAAGLAEDVLATATGGAWTISTTLVAIIAGALSRGFFADSLPLVCTIAAIATLLRLLIFWIVMAFERYPSGLATMHFHEALIGAALNAGVMLIAMLAVRRYDAS